MKYFNGKKVSMDFEKAIKKVTEELKYEGFGVLTEIDMQATMKEKLDVDFKKYRILGACNAPFAYKAFQYEDKIGLLLPCNVVVQENEDGSVEVSAVSPMASMMAIENEALSGIIHEIEGKLKNVIDAV
ncbi:MAG: DUF302 domain-containing protein [Crocinitomicaceae bacterium]|nr:DUF302 domain-containing protein [Crocinitomicaceae bacterium]